MEGILAIKDFAKACILSEGEYLGNLTFEDWYTKECKSTLANGSSTCRYLPSGGGLIMSDSADQGVIDKNLKIHNTENVYICGPSICQRRVTPTQVSQPA